MLRWTMLIAALLIVAAVALTASIRPTAAPAQADPPNPPETPEAPENIFTMSADAFFDLPVVDEPLARRKINDRLLRAAVFHQTNAVRAGHDLRPLQWDGRLSEAAAAHTRYLIEHETLSHENTHDPDRRWPMDRVRLAGYTPRSVSENVAQVFRVRYTPQRPYYRDERGGEPVFSYEPGGEPIPPHTCRSFAAFLLDEWMGSPGHRENILRPSSEELGVAIVFRWLDEDLDEAYATQVFAVPLQ